MRVDVLKHEFVESAPAKLEEGVLYVSIAHATVLHRCCCGCGSEVVTPLSPAEWRLTFDGETISLHPSLGNWGLPCKSHYRIDRNKVRWAEQWSAAKIEAGRADDRLARQEHFADKVPNAESAAVTTTSPVAKSKHGFWAWVKSWWSHEPK